MSEKAAARERPILFSGEMVRAILDGRKTQTRRVVSPQPTGPAVMSDPLADLRAAGIPVDGLSREPFALWMTDERNDLGEFIEHGVCCPYGGVGDRLWVREAWYPAFKRTEASSGVVFPSFAHPHGAPLGHPGEANPGWAPLGRNGNKGEGWRSPIHMPRWASRLTLEITDVRVQRVQEISEADAEAEGVEHGNVAGRDVDIDADVWNGAYRRAFRALWSSLNAKRGYSWDSNPWVWALTFRLLSPTPPPASTRGPG